MDREKQIEKLGKDIRESLILHIEKTILYPYLAQDLYSKNYRKINEDEIVISKGLLKDLTSEDYITLKQFSEHIKELRETRKETARDILKDLYYEAISNITETVELTILQIEELAEKYGVDLGEEQ